MPESLMLKNTHAPGEKGFTIIEVIAVIVVISILAAYAVSRMNFNVNLQAEADIFKSNLRYVQQIALCGDNTYTWRIDVGVDVGANSYTFTRVDSANNSVNMWLPSGDSTVNFPDGITAGWTGTINFDQWGSPGSDSIIIALADGSTTRSITVTKNTGFVP
ncbi:MAG: prepilin-type N-terminal cleavage/methylation domain-containing protein [Spirochaetales bacterium]|nr:prepilin-type N-terminal cleavage/methylation domain-containing protein [Spirochaetales bacterium]